MDSKLNMLKPYSENKEFKTIHAPNFEIQTLIDNQRKLTKKLIIFDPQDRNKCYKYCFTKNLFLCLKCKARNAYVSAKLCQNENGEEYIRLGKTDHECDLVPYTQPINKEMITMDCSKFVYKEMANGRSRLFVFASDDKKFCHEYTKDKGTDYYCLGCRHVRRTDSARVNLLKNNEGGYYLVLKNQNHLCKQPRKFVEEPEIIVNYPNFEFYKISENDKLPNLITFYNDEKTLYYNYIFDYIRQMYICTKCKAKNKFFSAKVFKNEEAKEFVRFGKTKHVCNPMEYSKLKDIRTFWPSGVNFIKLKEKDKKIIIKANEFELRRNKRGILNSRLIIFHSNDRNLCYDYYYDKSTEKYMCSKCAPEKVISAKYNKIENYIELGENEHVCEPKIYEPEIDVVKKPMFLVFEPENKTKILKIKTLFIFTDETQKFCYRYSYDICHQLYKCVPCISKKMRGVSAKICLDANGEEYVHFGQTNHGCEPQEFKPYLSEMKLSNSK